MKIQISKDQIQVCMFTHNPNLFQVRTGKYAYTTEPFADVPVQVINRWRNAEDLFWNAQAEMNSIYDAHWIAVKNEMDKISEQHMTMTVTSGMDKLKRFTEGHHGSQNFASEGRFHTDPPDQGGQAEPPLPKEEEDDKPKRDKRNG